VRPVDGAGFTETRAVATGAGPQSWGQVVPRPPVLVFACAGTGLPRGGDGPCWRAAAVEIGPVPIPYPVTRPQKAPRRDDPT
jgi:hypothetical protein